MSVRLPSNVYSPDQIAILLWELSQLTSGLRDAAVRASGTHTAVNAQDIHVSALLLSVLTTAQIQANDLRALEQLVAELEAIRDQAPVAHMVLPFAPHRSIKQQIIEWFRTEIHPQMLLTYAVRADIGGGFILRAGSRQRDLSYRGRLLANKQRIAEIFNGGQ